MNDGQKKGKHVKQKIKENGKNAQSMRNGK